MSTGADERPEAITLGLHDASPPHLVDVMADDVVLELGWGRLIFGQTFADAEKLAEVLRGETHGRRDICIYARESHVLVALAPAELFIDPSHTYRLRFSDGDESTPSPIGITVRTLTEEADADAVNRVYVRCGMVPAPTAVIWDNHLHADAVDYLVAMRDDGTVLAPSPASTTSGCSPTPRTARACGHWRWTPRPTCPVSVRR